jgi:hypothetical protein
MARKRVKVYQIGPDGKTLWRTTYEVGVKEGVKKYEAKIPYMVSSYSGWIDFVFDKLVETAAKIPEKIEGADPARTTHVEEHRSQDYSRRWVENTEEQRLQKY